jgi:hypothetical protein
MAVEHQDLIGRVIAWQEVLHAEPGLRRPVPAKGRG